MVVQASIVGVVKTVLIIIGVLVVLRFIGQLMQAKSNLEENRRLDDKEREIKKERSRVAKNIGKTRILGRGSKSSNVQDVDYEELND